MKVHLPMPELQEYLHAIYPQAKSCFSISKLTEEDSEMRTHITDHDLRPKKQFLDRVFVHLWTVAFYALTLSLIGKEALAVATNVNINFVKKT